MNDWNRCDCPEIISRDVLAHLKIIYQATTLQNQLDAFINLHDLTTSILQIKYIGSIEVLRQQITDLVSTLFDVNNNVEFKARVTMRKQFRDIDSDYMPWHTPITRNDPGAYVNKEQYLVGTFRKLVNNLTKKRLSFVNPQDVKNDSDNQVHYLSDEKREQFRIFPSKQKLMKLIKHGKGEDVRISIIDFDTKNYKAHNKSGRAIFVVSPKGDFFAASTINNVIHHSSLLAGQAAFFAGTMSVSNGILQYLDDVSGHYRPTHWHNIQLLAFLRKCGVLLTSRSICYKLWQTKFTLMNKELGYTVEHTLSKFAENVEFPLTVKTKVLDELNKYILSRVNSNSLATPTLNWRSQNIFDSELTEKKVRICIAAKEKIENTNDKLDYVTLMALIKQLKIENNDIEKAANKTYALTKSDLLKCVEKIESIVKEYLQAINTKILRY